MTAGTLRAALASGPVVAPGAHDGLTARLVEEAGFDAAFVSGATLSATRLGRPDLGFLGATDAVEATRMVSAATSLPVVVDADTGWGNAVHVAEHTRRLEAAGAAGIVIEDQVAPKRCGAMTGKDVIGRDEMASRITAAVDARRDTVVIARTDAAGVAGVEAATDRAEAYARAGADLVFPAGVVGPDTLARIRARTGDADLVVNCSEAASPAAWPSIEQLATAGAGLLIVPVSGLLAAVEATRTALAELRARGTSALRDPQEWTDLTDLLGLPGLLEQERRWAATERQGAS